MDLLGWVNGVGSLVLGGAAFWSTRVSSRMAHHAQRMEHVQAVKIAASHTDYSLMFTLSNGTPYPIRDINFVADEARTKALPTTHRVAEVKPGGTFQIGVDEDFGRPDDPDDHTWPARVCAEFTYRDGSRWLAEWSAATRLLEEGPRRRFL